MCALIDSKMRLTASWLMRPHSCSCECALIQEAALANESCKLEPDLLVLQMTKDTHNFMMVILTSGLKTPPGSLGSLGRPLWLRLAPLPRCTPRVKLVVAVLPGRRRDAPRADGSAGAADGGKWQVVLGAGRAGGGGGGPAPDPDGATSSASTRYTVADPEGWPPCGRLV